MLQQGHQAYVHPGFLLFDASLPAFHHIKALKIASLGMAYHHHWMQHHRCHTDDSRAGDVLCCSWLDMLLFSLYRNL